MHPQPEAGPAADLGTAEHELIEGEADQEEATADAFAELAARSTKLEEAILRHNLSEAAVKDLVEMHEAWLDWWPTWSGGVTYEREVPFALDVARWSGRRLPSKGQRDYSAAEPSEIPLTIDALHVDGRARVATVIDWKTGVLPQPKAGQHPQLLTCALAVASACDVDRVRVVCARVRPGRVWPDEAWVDAFDLASFADRLSASLADVDGAEPNPGRHCVECHCPALSACEGPRALAARAPELAAALPIVVQTEAQAAAVLGTRKALQAYLDALDAGAVAWAQANGGVVRLGDRSWARAPKTRRSIDLALAEAPLRKRFGAAVDGMIRVKRSLSVSEIEKAAAATAPRGKREDAKAEIMAELEATRGVKLYTYEAWEQR
jgi:hypothetical protein